MRRDPGVGRIGEVAVRGAANEASVTRRVEPAYGLGVGDDRCRWQLRLVPATSATTAMTPVPASVAVMVTTLVPIALVSIALVPTTLVAVKVLTAPVMVFLSVVRMTRCRRR